MALVVAAIFHPDALPGNFYPMFRPGGHVALQILGVAVAAPQLFIGFETPPLFSEESNFSLDQSKVIMDTCILFSGFFYIALTFLAAAALPVGYMAWPMYVHGMSFIRGVASVPTLHAAFRLMGNAGIWLWGAVVLAAILTGIIGCYAATSRLLYSMSHDRMLPSWFGVLNRKNVPFRATLFCMVCAVLMPFMGRTALVWGFDMASVGASISFGYTCLAARRYALQEGRRDIAILGGIGALFSSVMAFLLLVPVPGLDCSIEPESYLCLVLWSGLGMAYFFRTPRRALVTFRRMFANAAGRLAQWQKDIRIRVQRRIIWKRKTSKA